MGQISLPIYQSAKAVGPTELACLISGSDTYTMGGFEGIPEVLSAWNGAITVVAPDLDDSELIAEIRREGVRRRNVWIRCACAVALSLFFFALAIYILDKREMPLVPIEWTVTQVNARGLSVQAGPTKLEIPVGASLPNGDILLSTSSATNTYTTQAGTTRLGKN